MLTAAQLAAMRATCDAILDQTATIQRNAPVDDGQGGERESWSTVGTTACHVQPRSGQASVEGERPVSETLWTVLLPHGTDVRATDRLGVGSTTYEVTDLHAGESYPLQLTAQVRRVE